MRNEAPDITRLEGQADVPRPPENEAMPEPTTPDAEQVIWTRKEGGTEEEQKKNIEQLLAMADELANKIDRSTAERSGSRFHLPRVESFEALAESTTTATPIPRERPKTGDVTKVEKPVPERTKDETGGSDKTVIEGVIPEVKGDDVPMSAAEKSSREIGLETDLSGDLLRKSEEPFELTEEYEFIDVNEANRVFDDFIGEVLRRSEEGDKMSSGEYNARLDSIMDAKKRLEMGTDRTRLSQLPSDVRSPGVKKRDSGEFEFRRTTLPEVPKESIKPAEQAYEYKFDTIEEADQVMQEFQDDIDNHYRREDIGPMPWDEYVGRFKAIQKARQKVLMGTDKTQIARMPEEVPISERPTEAPKPPVTEKPEDLPPIEKPAAA